MADDEFQLLQEVAFLIYELESLMIKHPTARAYLKQLRELGCTIFHEVDSGTMSLYPCLRFQLFDRIVFNFPHAGFTFRESEWIQIQRHQSVVKGFLRSARDMLTNKGEVHVTHKTAHPFNLWEIEKLAEEAGLCLVEYALFSIYDYPGYENKRGDGNRSNDTFPVGACSTFKFAKP